MRGNFTPIIEKMLGQILVERNIISLRHLQLALDSTPIGDFAELEGSEDGIREVAAKLGLHESQFLRDSYYSLYASFALRLGKEPGNMVFSDQDKDKA